MNLYKLSAVSIICAAIIAASSCGSKEEPLPKPTPDPEPQDTTHVDPVDSTYFGIKTYADLCAFADSVNNAKSIERFCNEDGEVILLGDINMAEDPGTAWTPIGLPTSVADENNDCSYNGNAFKGKFNGQNHAILNFKAEVTIPDKMVWGLFGMLDGATVKNLVLGAAQGDESLITVKAMGTADFGILAGAAKGETSIMDCTNYIPIKILGTESNSRMANGCFVGYLASSTRDAVLYNLKNYGNIEMAAGKNTANGATGVMAGGIAGFCTSSGAGTNTIENCENFGNLSGSCGRSSGIAASMNKKTLMRYCINRGNNVNDFVNGRVGNLTCIMGAGCSMDDCTNYGDCITSDPNTTTAGMIALLNGSDVVVTGGGNYGKIIGADEKYHGLVCANFSTFSAVKKLFVGGSCGTYSKDGKHVMHELNKDNWVEHLGYYTDVAFAKISDLNSEWGEGGGNGGLPTLKDAPLRILFIGNSFTMDAVDHFPGICQAAGVDMTMALMYYGGRLLPDYYKDRSVSNNYLYYANPGDTKLTEWGIKASIEDVAKSGRWDVVTIMEDTGSHLSWIWNDTEKDYINNMLEFVNQTQQTKPRSYYFVTQVYKDFNRISSNSKSYITFNNQAEMFDVIIAQAKKVLNETNVDDLISTCTGLENLKTSKYNTVDDLTRDGYHMDYGLARYGASCLVFDKIIKYYYPDKSLDGNTYRYSKTGDGCTPVTDENAPVAQKAAQFAADKPFEITDMSEPDDDPSHVVTLSGQGTADSPYLITSGDDMKQVGWALEVGQTRYFEMTRDIDMSSITDWEPVNTAVKAKTIVFDGKNHKISGFKCTNKTYASIFGLVTGSVKNIVIEKPVVSNSSLMGVVAAWLGENGGSLPAEVSNVHITDATLKMTSSSVYPVGMIAANCGGATVSDCSASGTISLPSLDNTNWAYVGGLVGRVYATGSKVVRCSFSGDISTTRCTGFGGVVGGMGSGIAVEISDCFSQGSITGGSYAGGIVGELGKGSVVKNCFSTMSLSGIYNLGGIVARASNGVNPNSSGTFNTDISISVTNCIAWSPSIQSTNSSSESASSHYSSGAVVGFTTYLNTLNNCYRRADMDFKTYKDEYNNLVDTPDCGPSAPLQKPGSLTYLCPYNGKAAPSGSTVSSLANSLGWSTSVWNLDNDLPSLK